MKIKIEIDIDTVTDQEEIDSMIDVITKVKELIHNQKTNVINKGNKKNV